MTTPRRFRKGGGTSRIQPSVVNDGTAMMYDTSVKISDKRTPAATASHTGSFFQRHSVMPCASAEAGGKAVVEETEPDVRSDPGQCEDDRVLDQRGPEIQDDERAESALDHECSTLAAR